MVGEDGVNTIDKSITVVSVVARACLLSVARVRLLCVARARLLCC